MEAAAGIGFVATTRATPALSAHGNISPLEGRHYRDAQKQSRFQALSATTCRLFLGDAGAARQPRYRASRHVAASALIEAGMEEMMTPAEVRREPMTAFASERYTMIRPRPMDRSGAQAV